MIFHEKIDEDEIRPIVKIVLFILSALFWFGWPLVAEWLER
jgi:hypothetical protein